MQIKTCAKQIYSWCDERIGISDLLEFAKKKAVPEHKHTFWYYWGGISLLFFIIQAFTGALLLIYYRPGPDAYESVRQITYEMKFGWLIRSIHSWAANLMLAAVFIHMFSVFFMKAYRRPREIGWLSGLILLLVCMIFGFSGYLLPMDELAFFATKVGLEIPAAPLNAIGELVAGALAIIGIKAQWLGSIGSDISSLIRGGFEVNEYTVQRFFSLHVIVLPAVFLAVLGLHLYLVQKHGNAVPPSEEAKPIEQRKSVPFFPNFLMRDLAAWLIALNVLILLAAMFPWDLGQPADPLKPAPAGIHPEWYFMSSFQVLKAFGQWFPGITGEILGMILFTAGLVLWTLIPFYDNTSASGKRARRATWFGLFTLAVLVLTTIWGYLALK
ncbi:MAG TPA: cytochrome bc complex cytochrome b subunit [Verrucomicrobiota bacterium]|nr:cytochrome bc complex cytochrome b subunit [Verrucomicrobiota bacterium]